MKKILAGIIALTTVFCTFTGCGSINDEKTDSSETSVESTTELEENTEETSEAETEGKDNDEKTYEDVVNEYFNAMYSGDSKKLMELQVPDGCTDVLDLKNICIYTEDDDDVGINTSVEDYVKEIIEYYPKGKFVKIGLEYDLYESEKESLKESVSGYLILEDYIKEHGGVDNVDPDEIAVYLNENNTDEAINSVEFDDIILVDAKFLKDGEDTPHDKEFVIYRVKGGNWHIYETFYSFLNYSLIIETVYPTFLAEKFNKAANYSFVEMIEEIGAYQDKNDFLHTEKYMICSDDSKNINVPANFDTAYFKEKINHLFYYYMNDSAYLSRYDKKLSEFDWFIFSSNAEVAYSVIVPKGETQIITYPSDKILTSDLTTTDSENVNSMSFDEIYNICADIAKN